MDNEIKGYVHSIETMGLVDGPGNRTIFFLQGCPLKCVYCHNPDSQNIHGGKEYTVDKTLSEASASDYDALVLPGGVINPDQLRTNEDALSFVKDFFSQHKPVAAICHGPQILINAGAVEGRNLTSVKAISQDLKNAGAQWEDSEVVVDSGLVTSRTPEDLPAFNAKLVEEVKEGKHQEQTL